MTREDWEHTSGRWPGQTRGASPSERPSWVPVLLSGAFPRELSDFLAVAILALTSVVATNSQISILSLVELGSLTLLVPITTTLAALSDSTKRQREELALFAYGGTPWQIQGRYVLRGSMIVTLGLLPFLLTQVVIGVHSIASIGALLGFVAVGGVAYAVPGLRRTNSPEFVGQYKG